MSRFFAKNLQTSGRIIRGISGLLLLIGGVVACAYVLWLGILIILSAGFVLFEAVRGWCIMRACGIKTRY